jgi:putative endonuclease
MPEALPSWSAPSVSLEARHLLGHAGEVAAGRLLERHGFTVLAHRFRIGRHEVDLVVRQAALVCFVEVKTRASQRAGYPDEALGLRQQGVIAHVARLWAARHGRPGESYRFDMMAVRPVPDGWAVRWIRDAFRPTS